MGRERIIISRVVERCKPGFGSLSIHEPVFFAFHFGFFLPPSGNICVCHMKLVFRFTIHFMLSPYLSTWENDCCTTWIQCEREKSIFTWYSYRCMSWYWQSYNDSLHCHGFFCVLLVLSFLSLRLYDFDVLMSREKNIHFCCFQ